MKPLLSSINLDILASDLNQLFNTAEFDEPTHNGIQVANKGPIFKIATGVSASTQTIEQAAKKGAHALIVHHGILSKKNNTALTGSLYNKIKLLIDHNIALLCYHLPLDAHQELGNNWRAAHDLGLKNLRPFFKIHDQFIGVIGTCQPTSSFDEFKNRVEQFYGRPAGFVKVREQIQEVAIISGAADKYIKDAARAGADCFLTGRADEPAYDDAHDYNISFLALGHYATETIGVKALAHYIEKTYGIESFFIATENPF